MTVGYAKLGLSEQKLRESLETSSPEQRAPRAALPRSKQSPTLWHA